MLTLKYAILIDYLEWAATEDQLVLDNCINFVRLQTHPAGTLHKFLRKSGKFWEEELSDCQTAIIIESPKDYQMEIEPSEQTYSYSTELMTILTLIFKSDLGLCRVLSSKDNFKTCFATYTIYDNYPSVLEGMPSIAQFNCETFQILKSVWKTMKSLSYPNFHPRVINAFDFYYFSWNTIHLYSTAINLSVVLESLFSPTSVNELSHQIAFNVAKFASSNKHERIIEYKIVKTFYTVRSKLVHGGDVKSKELNIIREFFELISSILLKILTDTELFNTFNDDRLRRKYLEEFLFD